MRSLGSPCLALDSRLGKTTACGTGPVGFHNQDTKQHRETQPCCPPSPAMSTRRLERPLLYRTTEVLGETQRKNRVSGF